MPSHADLWAATDGLTQPRKPTSPMFELIRTNDVVLLDVARGLLESERIPVLVADGHMSVLEGSTGAFARRLLVPSDWAGRARRLLVEAGLGGELRDG